MPAHERSIRLTNVYRQRMVALRDASERVAARRWGELDHHDLQGSYGPWMSIVGTTVARNQRAAVQLSNAYLAAFISSEMGHSVRTPAVDSSRYVDIDRGGNPLSDALRSPLIGTLAALKAGKPLPDALAIGLDRARRMVGLATDTAARNSLSDAMDASPHIEGYRRAVKGTCDACLGDATNTLLPAGTPLDIHPGCQCVAEPSVGGIPDLLSRPTGDEIFNDMTEAHQDAQFGPERAQLLRDQKVTLRDLIAVSPMANEPDFITSKPLDQLSVNQ